MSSPDSFEIKFMLHYPLPCGVKYVDKKYLPQDHYNNGDCVRAGIWQARWEGFLLGMRGYV